MKQRAEVVKQAHGPTRAVASTACETNSRGRSSGEAEGSGGEAGTRPQQSGRLHGVSCAYGKARGAVMQLRRDPVTGAVVGRNLYARVPSWLQRYGPCEKKVRVMLENEEWRYALHKRGVFTYIAIAGGVNGRFN